MPEILIERPVEWLSEHNYAEIDDIGRKEILTANRHGDLHVGSKNDPLTVNVSDHDVTVL